MSKESLSNSPSHVEETDPTPQAETIVEYDSNGLSGIVRSPYVLGAATLASLGGFSFGYGKSPVAILTSKLTVIRPRCDQYHPYHETIPRSIP
jgi:hypothetical protein